MEKALTDKTLQPVFNLSSQEIAAFMVETLQCYK